MLGTLLESNARRPRRRAGLVASITIHTLLIGGALAATAAAKSRDRREAAASPPTIIYVPQSPRRDQHMRRQERAREPVLTEPGRFLPLPRTLFVPDLVLRTKVDVEPGRLLYQDTVFPPCVIRCGQGRASDSSRSGEYGAPATVATVDRAAALRSPPRPRYPDQLRAAGVTGRVLIRLVVDTLGRVEPASVVVRESSHDLFANAVLAILPALRFSPAEAGGRRVRMLVDLPFEFRLNE